MRNYYQSLGGFLKFCREVMQPKLCCFYIYHTFSHLILFWVVVNAVCVVFRLSRGDCLSILICRLPLIYSSVLIFILIRLHYTCEFSAKYKSIEECYRHTWLNTNLGLQVFKTVHTHDCTWCMWIHILTYWTILNTSRFLSFSPILFLNDNFTNLDISYNEKID